MSLLLAIDQSTSATKVLLCDSHGAVLDHARIAHHQHHPQPGWVEHDAGEIWRNLLEAIRQVLERNAGRAREVVGLSLTNQRETFVVFERGTGRPLHPAIVWQCRRGDDLCADAVAAGHGAMVSERTGLRIAGYFSAAKIAWLLREKPSLAAEVRAGRALIGTIDAWLIHCLTDGRVFATDATNASRTLLFDLATLAWNPQLCALWQVPLRALPEIRSCDARFGETTCAGLLPGPVPICGVMGDSQASLFAHRCFASGSAKATFGTGTSVLLNVGGQLPAARQASVAALAWLYRGRPTYALEGLINASAATFDWLRDQLGLVASVEELERLGGEVPDSGGVYLVPAFAGLSTPYWREDARGALIGLGMGSDRRQVARAALESVAYQLRDVCDALRAESGLPIRELLCDGGATTNSLMMQFAADVSGIRLRVASQGDGSALGAAWMGMLGLGLHSAPEMLPVGPQPALDYQPRMPAAQVAARYRGWQSAVRRVLMNETQGG